MVRCSILGCKKDGERKLPKLTFHSCSANASNVVMTSLQLYKYLLRQCEKLPPDACKHYKFAVRQSYKQHKIEPDLERVKEIINKSVNDSKWIVDKYTKK